MRQYEITYQVIGTGSGMVQEVVTAASDYNARNLIYAKYRGQTVQITSSRQVR
jgi:hypothetical protein